MTTDRGLAPVVSAFPYPLAYSVADSESVNAQKRFASSLATELVLLCAVAVLGAVPLRTHARGLEIQPLNLLGGVVLASALVVRLARSASGVEVTWYSARAAAESIKTLVWRFACCGTSFGNTLPASEVEDRYIERCVDVLHDLRFVDPALRTLPDVGIPEMFITAWMWELRAKPQAERAQTYVEGRLDDQLLWYNQRSEFHRAKGSRFRALATALYIVGIAAAAIEGFSIFRGLDVLGIAAAAAASFESWNQMRRHRDLETAYQVAVLELTAIRHKASRISNEMEWSSFIDDSEEAISREHTTWRASHGL
jgi:hypothetical protein